MTEENHLRNLITFALVAIAFSIALESLYGLYVYFRVVPAAIMSLGYFVFLTSIYYLQIYFSNNIVNREVALITAGMFTPLLYDIFRLIANFFFSDMGLTFQQYWATFPMVFYIMFLMPIFNLGIYNLLLIKMRNQ